MPRREDEYYVSQKEGLLYCYTHKRYYRRDIGCQGCAEDSRKLRDEFSLLERPQLQKCPKCKQESLMWNRTFLLYECVNHKCKKTFAYRELEERKG